MSNKFFKRFCIKLHWTYSEVALKVIEYLNRVPCNYEVERWWNNYYKIIVKFETDEEFEPVKAMLPNEYGIIVYR